MEESYRTWEEFNPTPGDPAPRGSARQARRPGMFSGRNVPEESPSVQPEASGSPGEPGGSAPPSLQRSPSIQSLTDKPWENVTLNRCLLVAITILVLSSGFHRLQETLRGRGTAEDEEDVTPTLRRSSSLRHGGQTPELDDSLWDVVFWWLPDFDDEDDDDDDDDDEDGELKRRKTKQSGGSGASGGLRNKPLPDKELMKHRDTTLKSRRAEKNKKEEEPGEEEEEEDEKAPRKRKKQGKDKKSQKG